MSWLLRFATGSSMDGFLQGTRALAFKSTKGLAATKIKEIVVTRD